MSASQHLKEFRFDNRAVRLFIILSGFFIANVFIAEFIGVKIFSLEDSLGIPRASFSLFGMEGLSFQLTAGVLLWPIVFVMTDVINEYFGVRGVRFLSLMAAGLIFYGFLAFSIGMELTPPEWWRSSKKAAGVEDYGKAFDAVFGQGNWIIVGSLVAFLVGQLVDAYVFRYIKRFTGHRAVWFRATMSTLVSQFIDSYVVLIIAFYIGAGWPLQQVLAIGLMNYLYKFAVAIALIPLLYAAHWLIDKYLGDSLAEGLRNAAIGQAEA